MDVIRESLEAVSAATDKEGVLKMNLEKPHNRHYFPMKIEYPTPYVDVRLEDNDKGSRGLDCDLTFWAVQFINESQAGIGKYGAAEKNNQ